MKSKKWGLDEARVRDFIKYDPCALLRALSVRSEYYGQRTYEILVLRYGQRNGPMTYKRIGKLFDISGERVRELVVRAFLLLRR